jgi:hypothetical protein
MTRNLSIDGRRIPRITATVVWARSSEVDRPQLVATSVRNSAIGVALCDATRSAASSTLRKALAEVAVRSTGIWTITKEHADRIGLDAATIGAHSFRPGLLTSAGHRVFEMRDVSRQKTMDVLQSNARRADLFRDHARRVPPFLRSSASCRSGDYRGMSCRSPYRRALRLPSGGLVRMEQLPLDPRSLAGRVLNIPANVGGSYRLHNVLSS